MKTLITKESMKKKGQLRRRSTVNNHDVGKQHRGESKQEGNSFGATRQQRLLCVLKGENGVRSWEGRNFNIGQHTEKVSLCCKD